MNLTVLLLEQLLIVEMALIELTFRDLSGRAGTDVGRRRAATALLQATGAGSTSRRDYSAFEGAAIAAPVLPKLDLSIASMAQKVTYDINTPGPVVKVRTGGLQSFR